MSSRLGRRFPLGIVLPAPQLHGVCIIQDMTILGVAGQGAARTLGNVTQVTEHRAAMAFGDLRVEFQRLVVTDGSQEIIDVLDVSARVRFPFDFLVFRIVLDVSVVDDFQATVRTIELDETAAIAIAAQSLPGGLLATGEFESHGVRVRCLLVILVVVTPTARGDACREFHTQTPTTYVERMNTVVS